jgi:hypothetical protein
MLPYEWKSDLFTLEMEFKRLLKRCPSGSTQAEWLAQAIHHVQEANVCLEQLEAAQPEAEIDQAQRTRVVYSGSRPHLIVLSGGREKISDPPF